MRSDRSCNRVVSGGTVISTLLAISALVALIWHHKHIAVQQVEFAGIALAATAMFGSTKIWPRSLRFSLGPIAQAILFAAGCQVVGMLLLVRAFIGAPPATAIFGVGSLGAGSYFMFVLLRAIHLNSKSRRK